MTDFTTPEDAPEAAIEPVAPVPPVAPVIEAKPKAKRKRKKAVKRRAPRTKKADPLASPQASDTPSRYPVSESALPLAKEGAAGQPPAAPLHLRRRNIIPASSVSAFYALGGGERTTVAVVIGAAVAAVSFGSVAAWLWW